MFVFNKEQKWNLDQRMLCRAELCTITRTLRACFHAGLRSLSGTPHRAQNAPCLGYLRLYQLKTRVQTMGDQNTETLLCTIKHPFSLKRRRHLNFFFLNYRFHNGKVDRYLSSFSGSVLTQAATCPPSAGAAFLVSHAGSPSLHAPFSPTVRHEHRQPSKGTQKQAPWPRQSNVWFHNFFMDTRDHD